MNSVHIHVHIPRKHKTVDASDVASRYADLKGRDLASLGAIYQRSHKISNIKGVPKGDLISDILRGEFGDRKVDEWMKTNDSAFSSLEGKLAKQGVSDPGGLAYAIGAKKYGAAGMAAKAAAGRKSGDAADSAPVVYPSGTGRWVGKRDGGIQRTFNSEAEAKAWAEKKTGDAERNDWEPFRRAGAGAPDWNKKCANCGKRAGDHTSGPGTTQQCPSGGTKWKSGDAALTPEQELERKVRSYPASSPQRATAWAELLKLRGKTGDDDMDNIAPGYQDRHGLPNIDAKTGDVDECPTCKGSGHPKGEFGQSCPTCEGYGNFKDYEKATGNKVWRLAGRKTGDAAYDAGLFGEEEGLKLGKPVNVEWLRLDHLSPESLSGEADRGGIKAEGKTPQIMALLRKKFSEKQFAAWSQCY